MKIQVFNHISREVKVKLIYYMIMENVYKWTWHRICFKDVLAPLRLIWNIQRTWNEVASILWFAKMVLSIASNINFECELRLIILTYIWHHSYGDYNPKVGREQEFFGKISYCSLHTDTNYNGMRLISFTASRNMVISTTRTCYPHNQYLERRKRE